MWNRRDAGQEGYERWCTVQLGCRTGGMQHWRDATLEGYRKGGSGMMQYGKDEAQEGFGTGGMQDR